MWPALHWVLVISVLEVLDPDRIRNPGVRSATFFSKALGRYGILAWIRGILPNTDALLNYFV
jgi:hypothetical protein